MSTFRGVGAVTRAIRDLISGPLSHDIGGSAVQTTRPDRVEKDLKHPTTSLYMFRAVPNVALSNDDVPTMNRDGSLLSRPRVPLDLFYLISFFGDDEALQPQLMLGSVVRTLHAQPIISRDRIRTALTEPPFDTDLAAAATYTDLESVRITPVAMSLEDLTKIWSVFFQNSYALSVVYQASPVSIEAAAPGGSGLPVQTRAIDLAVFRRPVVDRVVATADATAPIVFGSAATVLGRDLDGDIVHVRIDDVDIVPDAHAPAALGLTLDLAHAPGLRAGIRSLRVVQSRKLTSGDVRVTGESQPAAVAIRPVLGGLPTVVAAPGAGNEIHLDVAPPLRPLQRATLHLDGQGGAPSISADARSVSADTTTLVFPLLAATIPSGTYLVRLEVDGAQSVLAADAGGFTGPTWNVP